MVRITQRPVFEFEKEERLARLRGPRGAHALVTYYGGRLFVIPWFAGGLISRMLLFLFGGSKGQAVLTGLAVAFVASAWAERRERAARGRRLAEERERLDRLVLEVIDLEVERAWVLAGCGGWTRSFLFDAGGGTYLFLEEMADSSKPWSREFPTRRLTVEREPGGKVLWDVRAEGPPVVAGELPFEAGEVVSGDGVECEVLRLEDLPEEVRAAVSAA